MQFDKQERCEACDFLMKEWKISSDCTLLLCPRCFHIKRDIKLCGASARKHAWGGSEFFDKIRTILTMRRLNKLLPKNKELNVLEIGFGSGKMLTKFLKKGHKVYGIDNKCLEIRIEESLKKHGILYFDKAERIQLPEENFDLIYAIHLIEHLEAPAEVFKKCYDALRKGGLLYLMTPNSASKGLTVFRDRWWNLEDPTHIRFFSFQSVGIMLEKAGFERIETGIPIWDSLTLEISSLLRLSKRNSDEHGVLSNKYIKLVYALILPFNIIIRIFFPKISPSLEIIARRSV